MFQTITKGQSMCFVATNNFFSYSVLCFKYSISIPYINKVYNLLEFYQLLLIDHGRSIGKSMRLKITNKYIRYSTIYVQYEKNPYLKKVNYFALKFKSNIGRLWKIMEGKWRGHSTRLGDANKYVRYSIVVSLISIKFLSYK